MASPSKSSESPALAGARLVGPEERFQRGAIALRLVRLDDCTPRYVAWLENPEVNRYLETRWSTHTIESVTAFVRSLLESPDSYLFAITIAGTGEHIGNIKLGPVHPLHRFADVSYFIGEPAHWGLGHATTAIRIATAVGFERLGLERVQAGIYEGNVGSGRALERAGFRLEARLRRKLRLDDDWEDHLIYGILRQEWPGGVLAGG
jgi:RimJ/RimL family protein N-acetyltransferase